MHPLVTVVASAVGLAFLLWFYLNSARSIQSARTQSFLGILMIVTGISLLFARVTALAVPLLAFGLGLMFLRKSALRQTSKTRTSQVRSEHLEMTLNHQSGHIDGRVLTGLHEGQLLSELGFEELLRFRAEINDDVDSIRLLETFLDKNHPDWRAHKEEDEMTSSGQMSKEDAYKLLGLNAGSSAEEIREAYSRLIKRVHPDQGGSAALAAQITEARDRLLGD